MNSVKDHKKYQLLLILLISFFLVLTFPGLAKAETETASTGAASAVTVSAPTASPAPAASEATSSVKASSQAASVASGVSNSGNADSGMSPSGESTSASPQADKAEQASSNETSNVTEVSKETAPASDASQTEKEATQKDATGITDQEKTIEAEEPAISAKQEEAKETKETLLPEKATGAEGIPPETPTNAENQDSSTPADPKKPLTPEDEDNSSPLEIDGEVVLQPVGDGSKGSGCFSSGGGGSSGGSGGFFSKAGDHYTRPGFSIVKVSEDKQNPMKVAFRITNLKTDESHIVVTDEDGKVNGLTLAETFDLYVRGSRSLHDHSKYYEDPEKEEPDLYGRDPNESEQIPKDPWSNPMGPLEPSPIEPDPNINQNDEFEKDPTKDKPNSSEPLKYEDIYKYFYKVHKDGKVTFTKKHKSDKLTLTFSYQLERKDSDQEAIVCVEDQAQYEVDSKKFDKDTFIREVQDFLAAKADQNNKTQSDENKKVNQYSYTLTLVDYDRPKYKVEELRTDTNLNHNLKTFYLQPGDLKRGNRGPWDVIQEIWMGDTEDKLTTKLQSTADQNEAALAKRRKTIEEELKKIEVQINKLNKNQENKYSVKEKNQGLPPSNTNTRYTVTVKKLIDADRIDPKNLINEFGDLYQPYGGYGPMSKLNLKAGDYDDIQEFDSLAAAQKYIDSLKFSPNDWTKIFPGNLDISFITKDNLLVRVYPKENVDVLEMGNPIKSFDNAFEAYQFIDEENKLPDDYYKLILDRYELEKERQALNGGYELNLSSPPKGLENALKEYDKNKTELLYKQRRYYLKEEDKIWDRNYKGPYTLLIYDKDPDLLTLKQSGGFGSAGIPLEDWLNHQFNMKRTLEEANLGLTPKEQVFQNREELEQWFTDNDMANLDGRLRMVDSEVISILLNASPMNPILRTTVENEKFDFKTLATHGSGAAKTVKKSTKTMIQDKITYKKLNIGSTYKFVGKLVHKATGQEVETVEPIVYETEKLTARESGEDGIVLNITFDSSPFKAGDEFVLLYDIYENSILVGKEDEVNNADQTISLMTTPPGGTPGSNTRIIRVAKAWDLAGRENPVSEIIVELYRDGEATGKQVKLNADNNWTESFTGLEIADKANPAKKYQYTIKEVGDVNGLFESDGKKFDVSYTGNMFTGFTITNKEIPEEPPETPEEPPKTPEEPPVTPPKTPEEPPVTPPEEPPVTPEEPPVVPQTPPTVPEAPGKAPQTGLPANGAPFLLIAMGLVGLRLTRRRKRTDGQ
ncbi:MAG: Cna B-type domain-containing protein [Clostridia bacterium]|nr:Cna B-type domain-containing protein [Clostridiales bacterium]MDU7504464.1 Cna B-type domain-containing protein [Clostridia bacterium]